MSETSAKPTPQAAISRLLRPRSVAIVGASPTPGSLGGGVLGNLIRFGYSGEIHLVNPSRSEIEGRPCVATTRDLPQGVDCAVLAIPQKGVMDAVRGCAERGVGGVICFSSGFAEAGEAGVQAQADLAELAQSAGMAVMGPNCLGMINFVDGIALTFGAASARAPKGPGLAIVSQSGAMATVVRAALHARDIGVLDRRHATSPRALDRVYRADSIDQRVVDGDVAASILSATRVLWSTDPGRNAHR